jgi:serine protease Do
MDTYEENQITPQPQEEEQTPMNTADTAVPVEAPAAEEPSDGFYHGAGVQEVTYITPEPSSEPAASQPAEEELPTPRFVVRQRRCAKVKKVLKCMLASVLVTALVSAACGVSIVVTNRHWQVYNQRLIQNFEQQIQVLRQELEASKKNDSSLVIVPTEGMTPSQIYQKNINSVVAVNSRVSRTENGKVYDGFSAGSGFVMSKDGYIVTNHHVIEGSTSISVTFADGRQIEARLIGSDAVNDIAMLKIEAMGLEPVTLGSSADLRVGDQVVAIGNALGELSFSLTVGYVSGIDRSISTDGSYINMIQTDASINSGNSGGPLFNSRGEVVGITTAKYSGTTSSGASIEGIGFAIPMNDMIGMLNDLRQYGYITGAYMGILVQDVDPVAAEMYGLPMGAYVVEPTPGYAAQKAGIQAKDIITNVGGYPVTCMSDLTRALRNFKAGDETTVMVWRSGKWIPLVIVFDEKPHS